MRGARLCLVVSALAPPILLLACTTSRVDPPADDDAGDAALERPAEDVAIDADAGGKCVLPLRYGSEECDQCNRERCCDVILACEAHPICNPLSRCVLQCLLDYDAGSCRKGCEMQFPAGVPLYQAVFLCGVAEEPVGCRAVCTTKSL